MTGGGLALCVARNNLVDIPPDLKLTVGNKLVEGKIVISPQEVAYQAIATLQLPSPKPGIGPPPSINPWKMAAVGYPLWLWRNGNMNPGRVSSQVANLSVALDATVEKVVFTMGDGHSMTCTAAQAQHPWHRGIVKPGTPSRYCGYRYTKPSLPRGKYTVTAYTHYRINWELNGVTGSQEYVRAARQRPAPGR